MINLAIAIGAVLIAYLANIASEVFSTLIILSVSLYVFGLLFYQAQLLPESAMTYLDNRLIHDGETPKNKRTNIQDLDVARSISRGMEMSFVNTEIKNDRKELIHPLVSLLIQTSQRAGVECIGIESLDSWLSSVPEGVAKEQVCKVIQTIEEAKGIVPLVKLSAHGDSLEVRA